MRVAALRVGALVNQSDWARDAGLPATTVDRTTRPVKSPKAYWSDAGLATFLAGETTARGFRLENLVSSDLLVWRDAHTRRPSVMHWRTAKGVEVDGRDEHHVSKVWSSRSLPCVLSRGHADEA